MFKMHLKNFVMKDFMTEFNKTSKKTALQSFFIKIFKKTIDKEQK